MMEDMKEAVLTLIDICAQNGDLGEQERLMLSMLNEVSLSQKATTDREINCNEDDSFTIRTNLDYHHKQTQLSIRQVFGEINSVTTQNLTMTLADIMAYRSEPILPTTQDTEANEEALTTSAISLTRHAFYAAQLYIAILSIPGSWGAGFVDVVALSNLSALVRRWCVECTSSSMLPDDSSQHKGKRKGGSSKAIPAKKKRPNDEDSDHDDDDSLDLFIDDKDEPDGVISNPLSLRMYGLKLAEALAQIPMQPDFLHWSDEASEVVLDAFLCAFMTVAALSSKDSALEYEPVVILMSQSLAVCTKNLTAALTVAMDAEIPKASVSQSMTIFILRGVFSILSMRIEVPHGQKGKDAAHIAAVALLERMIAQVAKQLEQLCFRAGTPKKAATTATPPGTLPHKLITPRTGRSNRKKRASFGTIRGKSIERLTAPVLKEVNTPLRQRPCLVRTAAPVNSMFDSILGILQKLVTLKDLDRSEIRRHTMTALTRCLPVLPQSERTRFLRFASLLCSSKISVHRLAGVELIGRVLSEPWFWDHHVDSIDDSIVETPSYKTNSKSPLWCSEQSMPSALLGALTRRLSDKAPAVRARAASSLLDVLISMDEENAVLCSENKNNFHGAIEDLVHEMMKLLRLRALGDDRATVRKAAIMTLSKLSSYCLRVDINDQDILHQLQSNIELFGRLCNDTSVAARKSASCALTDLLLIQYSSPDSCPILDSKFLPVEYAWTSFVLPLVLDSESSCVANAVDMFKKVVVYPLIENKDEAWRILACVSERAEEQGSAKAEYEALKAAVLKLTELDEIDVCFNLFNRIRDAALMSINDEAPHRHHSSAFWCFLRTLTDQTKDLDIFIRWIKRKSVGHEFITEPLQRIFAMSRSADVHRASLHSGLLVLSKLAAHLPTGLIEELASDLKSLLGEFHFGPEVIGPGVTASIECFRRCVVDQALRSECSRFIDDLYKKCEEEISQFVSTITQESSQSSPNYERLVRAVYLSGELAMVGYRSDESGSTKETDTSDPIIGLARKPSEHLWSLIQVLLPKTLPGDELPTPEPARAHAFVALGKMCLRDERLAKDSVNLFARELHQNLGEPCIAVQSNALLVLGDLCLKYTNLVDRHLPVMAACLQAGVTSTSEHSFLVGSKTDDASLVRKHAVLMLSRLLLQDFIKWRGLMFHRFLVATSDGDEGVSSLAEMTLCGPLLNKFPRLFLNNFVESLLVLNRCTAHPIYMAAALAGDNGAGVAVGFDGIDLSGATGQARRYQMYQMMLSKMSDEEKIGVTARLTKDILGAAVHTEGDLGRVCRLHGGKMGSPAEEAAYNVLSDAFHILTSPWLRVGRSVGASATDDDIEDPIVSINGKSTSFAVAKGRLLSNISRKQMIEIILPILCNLKSILQTSCSPLLKELSTYLVEVFRLNKTEVTEFLANDPTLLQEVEYDLKMFAKSQRSILSSPGATSIED